MRMAANALLENLSVEQRARIMFDFDNEAERRNWDFIPKGGRKGLPLKDMDGRQQQLAQQLIAAGVSLTGYTKVVSIMAMENVLREMQRERLGLSAPEFRNPLLYFVSIFNQPNMDETWGWRVVGHHVSLNFTIVGGFFLAGTPSLLGNEPAEFGVVKPLTDDENLGFDLLYALDARQRGQAIIHDVAPPDFVTRVVPRLGAVERPEIYELGFDHYRISEQDREALKYVQAEPRGVPGSSMDREQLSKLTALVENYIGRLPDDVAQGEMDRLRDVGLEQIHFAWAGQPERGKPHYYRLQGPALLIEFDNTQASGNHIHTVIRTPVNDFGDDLLRQHYAEEHGDALPVRLSRVTSTEPR
jgi:hypothetical protein